MTNVSKKIINFGSKEQLFSFIKYPAATSIVDFLISQEQDTERDALFHELFEQDPYQVDYSTLLNLNLEAEWFETPCDSSPCQMPTTFDTLDTLVMTQQKPGDETTHMTMMTIADEKLCKLSFDTKQICTCIKDYMNESQEIETRILSSRLKIEKRRMYEIVQILVDLRFVEYVAKGKIKWIGDLMLLDENELNNLMDQQNQLKSELKELDELDFKVTMAINEAKQNNTQLFNEV